MVKYRVDTAQDRESEPSEMEPQTRVHRNTETQLSSHLATMDKQVQERGHDGTIHHFTHCTDCARHSRSALGLRQ